MKKSLLKNKIRGTSSPMIAWNQLRQQGRPLRTRNKCYCFLQRTPWHFRYENMDDFIDESQQLFCDKFGQGRGLIGELQDFQNRKKNFELRGLGPLSEMRCFFLQSIQSKQMAKKTQSSKRKMKISVKRRLNLIDLVYQQKMSVVRASKKLELKVCTARSILSKYKKKGIIYDKKEKKHIVPDLPRREESEHLNSSIEDEAEEVQNVEQQPEQQICYNQTDENSGSGSSSPFPVVPNFVNNLNMFFVFYYF